MSHHARTLDSPAEAAAQDLPSVPLTLEGSSVLHQMFRMRWPAWNRLDAAVRAEIASEAVGVLQGMEGGVEARSAAYSLIGHKGDLLLIHFRESFDELNRAELAVARLRLAEFLEPTGSYLSVVELGLYDSSIRLYRSLAERGIEPHSPEWRAEVEEQAAVQRKAMHPRLYPSIPPHRYLCFYPMDRKRGENKNFYTVPIAERGRMMREHGLVGRRYAASVHQIITGSMGFDDWEWGVDLFSDDPLAFKKLIYEMRFDEVSAVYALFGSFYIGVRCPAVRFSEWLAGELPDRESAGAA
jgi:hydrogen peroxide-dependent heme synthase